jgi:hypothetical protein
MDRIPNIYLKARRKKCGKLIYQTDGRTECKAIVPFNFIGRGLKAIEPEQIEFILKFPDRCRFKLIICTQEGMKSPWSTRYRETRLVS